MVNVNLLNSKDEMTKSERVNATLKFMETDRVCTYDILQNKGVIEYFAGEKMDNEKNREVNLKIAGKAINNCFDLYRPECIWVPDEPRIETTKDGFVKVFKDYMQWIEKRPFSNVKELREWIKKNIRDLEGNWSPSRTYWHYGWVEFFKDSYEDYFDDMKKLMGDTVLWHIPYSVGLDVANEVASISLFSELYADYPDIASEWLETIFQYELKRAKYTAERYSHLSPLVLIYSDLAYKGGLMYSPPFLKKEFFPKLKKLNDVWNEYGVKCIFHSDGNFMDVMEDFIETGIDGIQSIEPLAGWDLIDLREKYPDLILVGNIDASQLLPYGNTDEVKNAVKKAIDDIYPTGGLILGSCTELHPGVPTENAANMVLFAREYSRIKPFRERKIDEIEIYL